MPTTLREAEIIADIVVSTIQDEIESIHYDLNENDSFQNAKELSREIFANLVEIAYQTENYSLRSSLFMVYRVLNPSWRPDYAQLCDLVGVYADLQPEMSYQEFLGLTNEEWIEFIEGCHT